MGKKSPQIILILIFVIFLLSLRMIHPSADPPENLSMSAGEYGDPGGYAFNARNKILFGRWEIDEINSPLYSSPIPALLTYLSFKLFGIGFGPMNLIPILFACLSMILVFFILKKTLNSNLLVTVIAFSFLGFNYLFIMYSRIANRVMPMVFFLVLALYFILKGEKNESWLLLAGFASFLAIMTKGVCLYAVGAFFLGLFVYLVFKSGLKKSLLPFFYYIAGFSVCLLLWIVFIYIPHGDSLKSISQINVPFLIPPQSLYKILYYFWIRPSILFEKAPVLSLLSGLSFLFISSKASREPKRLGALEWIMLFWLMISIIYFSIIQQRVTRHFIPQIIPMVFLSAWLIRDWLRSPGLTKPRKPNFIFGLVLFIWFLFPVSKILKPILDRLPGIFSNIWMATSLLAITALLLTLFTVLLLRLWPDSFSISFSPPLKKTLVALILLGILFCNGRQYLAWALRPQFKLKSISLDLGKAFDQAAIAGLWAPVVCLENRHRAHESYPGFGNDEKDFLKKFKITHVFASTFFNGLEINYYRQNFPQAMQKAKLLVKYPIWRGYELLYELNPPPSPPSPDYRFEAETFTREQGMPRYDKKASGQFSVLAEKREPGFVAVVSMPEKIPRGSYYVVFRMKLAQASLKSLSRMARIDVVSPETRRLLEAKDLKISDFASENRYQEFSVPIELKRPYRLELRVYSDGRRDFWVDLIRVEKAPGV